MTMTFYHNPRCSKRRQAPTLLRKRGIEPDTIEYLRQAPGVDDLRRSIGPQAIRPPERVLELLPA